MRRELLNGTQVKSRNNLRFFFSAVALLMTAVSAFAQGNGAAGITEATQMVTSYFDPATKLIYAIGTMVGVTGCGRKAILIRCVAGFLFQKKCGTRKR
jgi:hypothetical protein